jgi:ribosomal protein S12 methylthiotransferase
MPVRVGCISLGCPKNLVDSEIMLGILQKGDFEITTDLMKAEAIIVNTCAFIGDAKEEAVDAILEAALLKKTGNLKALVVTGCLAQRYKENIINEIPEVDVVVGTGNIPEIRKAIETKLSGDKENVLYTDEPDGTGYLDNRRELSEDGASKYLKIAEGCSNFCTYCIIPALRGPFRSRTIESILTEAEFLVKKGAKELIIIAQDVSRYGEDNYGESKLVDLIRKLSEIEDLKWIRLLYCYPERITKELITELKTNPKLVKYLDIPIQHASDSILKAMGRKSRREDLIALMTMLRKEISDIILRTTLISGFPGETEEDFQLLCDFIKEYQFDRLGVFAYSREDGTPAAIMKNQVAEATKQKRRNILLDLQQEIALAKVEKRIGKTYEVVVEGVADDGIFYYGRSYGEAPEIDPVIYIASAEPLEIGAFVRVKILDVNNMDLIGEVVDYD